MPVSGFDHVAIPSARPEALLKFYRGLGFTAPSPQQWRATGQPFFAIQFGDNKINVHAPAAWQDPAMTLRATAAVPGCGDFCFVWKGTVDELRDFLAGAGASVEEGPIARAGARRGGRAVGTSIYTRDPEGNLLEFMVYPD